MNLSHVCIKTLNLKSLAQFYIEVLGFSPIHVFVSSGGEKYGYFLKIGKGSFLEVLQDQKTKRQKTGRLDHFCLHVDRIDALHRKLKSCKKVSVIQRGRTDKVRRFQIEDPDGNTIEFHSFDKKCVQYPHR